MPVVLGVDLGTTKITAVAVEVPGGAVRAAATAPSEAETTSPTDKARGYSEWDARRIVDIACGCLRDLTAQLAGHGEPVGLGITGQQHGVLLLDDRLTPRTPLINWQDRRGDQPCPNTDQTYVRRALERAGPEAPQRTGCRLAAGYMGVTLSWMKATGVLLANGLACFLMDYFAALLTDRPPVTDATCAASSGLFDVAVGTWDADLLTALELPRRLFPEVRPSGERLGGLTSAWATATGLPAGLPVFVGIGDNQASFLGSVGDPADAVLVNVGTGGQVTTYSERFRYDPLLETRPFPRGGYLLVAAGLSGGAAYAVLERFFRQCGTQFFGIEAPEALYSVLNQLAAVVPSGAEGLRCEPFFSGTRLRPELRASWSGVSAENFTPAHLTRALLDGMARTFRNGYDQMVRDSDRPRQRLIGAGNGLRENPVLARIVAEAFALPLSFPRHREEAAYGAALLAGVGAGLFPDVATAGRIIQYQLGG
jgi:sugar (pentulose or hexulose) kinase